MKLWKTKPFRALEQVKQVKGCTKIPTIVANGFTAQWPTVFNRSGQCDRSVVFFFFFQSFLLFVKLQRSPSIYKHVKLTIKPGLLSPNTKARVDMNSASCRRNSLWRFPCFIWKNKFKTIHISTHTYVFILVSVFFCFCFCFFHFRKIWADYLLPSRAHKKSYINLRPRPN